jgi:hypothetical protein
VTKIERQYCTTERTLADVLGLGGLSAEELEARADGVSGWSVAQQLDHLALAGRGIFRGLAKNLDEESMEARSGVTFPGRVVLFFGWIPRGKGKAPKGTQPEPQDLELELHMEEMNGAFESLEPRLCELVDRGIWMPHPYFGGFDAVQWLRFTEIHNRHHLKIIREIRANAGQVTALTEPGNA